MTTEYKIPILAAGLSPSQLLMTDVDKKIISLDYDSSVLDIDSSGLYVKPEGLNHDLLLNVHQDVNVDGSPIFARVSIDGVGSYIDTDGGNNLIFVDAVTGSKTLAELAAGGASSDSFKTITGITNDVVADSATDILTLASADAKLTIVGTTVTDTITFTVVEGQIAHDNLSGYSANKHIDHTGVSISPGTGMSGGGDLTTTRTLTCTITQYTDALARAACIAASISDGDLTHSPDGNSVFDALALKAPLASPTFTGIVTMPASTLVPNNGTLGQAAGPLLTFDDTNNYLEVTGCSVGIGTATPSQALDLIGSLELEDTTTSTTGVIYKGANRFAHNFHHPTGGGAVPTGQNTFFGELAGNFTMGSTATSTAHASWNNAMGYTALRLNTTGYENNAMGYSAMYANTTGYENNAMGTSTLGVNTTGYRNNAMGAYALFTNTTGYDNNAMGAYALFTNTTGYDNNAMGAYALQNLKPTSGAITAFADYSGTVAGTVKATSVGHGLAGTTTKQISGTVNYNGSRSITVIDVDNFYFTAAWVATETGWWAIVSEGRFNSAVGSYSGYNLTTGSSNVFLGYNSGYNQTTNNNLLIIDNQDRTTAALEITNSLLYGVFAATPVDQTLRINGVLTPSQGIVMLDGGTIGQSAGPLLTFDDTNNYLEITGCNVIINHTASIFQADGETGFFQVHCTDSRASLGFTRWSNDSGSCGMWIGKSRGTNFVTNVIVQNGDSLGRFAFSGDDGTDLNSRAAQIECVVDGTPGVNDMPGRLVFSTTPDGSESPVERLRINSAGAIGMSGNLQVNGAFNFAVDAQATDAYVVTLSPAPTAYTAGMLVVFDAKTINTGACTLNVNSLGAKALKVKHDQDPANGYIEARSIVMAVYDGTVFQILSTSAL